MIKAELCKELSENFLGYAEAVNSDRAIPDAKSGLKPVARRILWIMYDTGFTSNKPHKKCAKTVGEVMGRVHPHGDSSIYEAMVRLSQPWVLRYPLVDFHGNWGSMAGDGPAAARYTESRLSKIAEEGMLEGIKKKVVDFQPNYSEDEEEPITLPSLMPNLLVNPNKGIGVSLACSWLPHNLTEVCDAILATLKGEDVSVLPGPDFPTGGTIVNKDELAQAYKTGRGRAIVRGKYKLEERGKKKLIVFYEIPYDVKTEKLLDQINEYCTKEKLEEVNEIRDESGKKGLRIVIEVNSDVNEVKLLNKLFKGTDLQKSCSFNQVALVDKKPVLLNLKEAIQVYINHQIDIIKRAAKTDLDKAKARMHIIEGLLIALEDIDNVIALIKGSESAAAAKENLIKKYSLTEVQAKAILDMKLAKLAKLEKIELEQEKKSLLDLITELEELLQVREKQVLILENQLQKFKEKFGDARRTEITQIATEKEEKEIEQIIPKDVVVIVSKNNTVKKIAKSNFKTQKRNGVGVKTNEDIILSTIKTNTIDHILFFSNKGKMYKTLVDDIPDGTNVSKGTSIATLIPTLENGEVIVAAVSLDRGNDSDNIVFLTKNGLIKKTAIKEYKDFKRKTGVIATKIKDGDAIADIAIASTEDVIITTHKGMAIRINLTDIPYGSRISIGVKGIKLNEGDSALALNIINSNTKYLGVVYSDGIGKKVDISEFPVQKRDGKGILVAKDKSIAGTLSLSKGDLILLSSSSQKGICIAEEEIPLLSRQSSGNILMKNANIMSIARV